LEEGGGIIVSFVGFSVFGEPVAVDWTIIGDTKELYIHGAHLGYFRYLLTMVMLVKKQVPVADIVAHTFPLAQFGQAFQLVLESKDSIKVMLQP